MAVDQRTPTPSPRKCLIPPPADPQPHYLTPNRSDSRTRSSPSIGPCALTSGPVAHGR
uniref:Uncharacterized protein n=1 Tax=Romanomermis culicivorax TaxID=13658 RepID=A0A915JX27_ROMCU